MAETWDFSGPDNTPTEAERRLIAAAEAGGVADCTGLSKTERVVSASLLVAVATGKYKPGGRKKWELHDNGVQLVKASIQGRVEATNRAFPAPLLFARCRFSRGVNFINATVDGNLGFDACLLADESRFAGAEIAGQFSANGARFLNRGGRAVFAQDVQAKAWYMAGARVYGAFAIGGAVLSGQFSANGARFLNRGERAVYAQGVQAGAWFMDRARVYGAFAIGGAVLSGQFSANGARFLNRGERAVHAQGVRAGDWFMDRARVYGAFVIQGAALSGEFGARGARFLNRGGHAINAQFSDILGSIFLRGKAFCRGRLSLEGARIGQLLDLAGAELDAGDGATALALTHARIEGQLRMPLRFPKGIVDLSRAHAATLVDAAFAWPKPLALDCRDGGRLTREVEGRVQDIEHMVLDGFTYDHIEYPAGHPDAPASAVGKARIAWLCGQSARDLKEHFNPQPWQQMAKVLREMRYEKAAKEVSITCRRRELCADGMSLLERFTKTFLFHVSDKGYGPWHVVGAYCVLVVLSALIYWGGQRACNGLEGWDARARLACAGHPAFVQTKFNDFEEVGRKGPDGTEVKHRPSYPAFNAFWYSLDVALPLIDTGSEGYWRANTKAYWSKHPAVLLSFGDREFIFGEHLAIGWLLYGWSVFQMLMAAILIAIAVTGFTGLLTRDEK